VNAFARGAATALAAVTIAAAQPAIAEDRASFTGSFTVAMSTPAERGLPLFDPVGEAAWAPGWAPVFARDADRASLPGGTVFTTRDHDRTTAWVLQRYDRQRREIAYTVYDPGEAVVSIRISVRERGAAASEALVRYDVVATSPAGDRFVRDFAAAFPHRQPHWQHAVEAAIARWH
jgi:hypothetical protein